MPSNEIATVIILTRHFSKKVHKSQLTDLLLNMPKAPAHIPVLQQTRHQTKARLQKYSPGTITLQVLGNGAKGSPRALYVFSDQARYLFNCGEGAQRLAHEHKMKLSRLEHLFFTHNSWENIGGLPGVALTVQDIGVPKIHLHGPPGLEEIFQSTRRFIILRDLQMKTDNLSVKTFEDSAMRFDIVHLWGSKLVNKELFTSNVEEDDTDYYDRREFHSRNELSKYSDSDSEQPKKKLKVNSGREKVMDNMPLTRELCQAYICRPHKKPGSLMLEICVEKGVPPGPLLGKLKAGENITLANGNIVKPEDVCQPDDPGPVFIVLECPSESFLESLISNDQLKQHHWNATSDPNDNAYCVVHFTPAHIMKMKEYKEWIELFSPSTIHITINGDNCGMGSIAVHKVQHKLRLLSPKLFPLLQEDGVRIGKDNEDIKNVDKEELVVKNGTGEGHVFKGETLLSCHLRPRRGIDGSLLPYVTPEEWISEVTIKEGFREVVEIFNQKTSQLHSSVVYPQILFLGTGSCIPNKTRNTSGIVLRTGPEDNILLDCGEATYGQLVRFFGNTNVDQELVNLKAISISHLHADHHIGLIGILKGRRKAFKNLGIPFTPVLLIAPHQILTWLLCYHARFESIGSDFELFPTVKLIFTNTGRCDYSRYGELLQALNMTQVTTTPVIHCPHAFGIGFTHSDGWKIVYSGDTMPCQALIEMGQGCDLLIHEATMEDELANEAITKMHSTTSQAIQVGKSMGAKFTLLTHFSQRYAKVPRFNENFNDNVGIAFDNMLVSLSEVPIIPHMYEALKLMFSDQYEEMELKTQRKLLKIERQARALQKM